MTPYAHQVASILHIKPLQAASTIKLLEEGATVPFISRYRKEATGSLDELQIASIKTHWIKLQEVDKRRETILATIEEQGKLTTVLEQRIRDTWSLQELEDLYLPFKPKRKTKASVAREKGLEPLAGMLMKQQEPDVVGRAKRFINRDVASVDEALAGARDIMAEWINESIAARNTTRQLFDRSATLQSKLIKGKEQEGLKYRDYFQFSEKLKHCPPHRLMALFRGESEGVLRLAVAPEEEEALKLLERIFIKQHNEASKQVKLAVKDAYKRLLSASIANETRSAAKERADKAAIDVFAENLRQLLLAAPLGRKRVLAIDPGFRTGCKVVCLNEQGDLLFHSTIYPHAPQKYWSEAETKLKAWVKQYQIEAIAIGNGTAGRETEDLVHKLADNWSAVEIFSVSESGASVYSASTLAREEFPDYDVTVRGSVSIGRRLMDPLAELVKIDPKSIGVGQYQHDVDQSLLKQSLDQVVESCVNHVGVNLNTASKHLLTYVSGLGPKLAGNITEYRAQQGPFTSRQALLKVPGLGPKAFEQSAGFLRIPDAKNPLDNSAVHPERYTLVKEIAQDTGLSVEALMQSKEAIHRIEPNRYTSDAIGLPTLKDILQELQKPGRDPRGAAESFSFSDQVRTIEDLSAGMVLPGLVTNITNFGAFVDIGVKQDGLIHVSQMADRFVRDPNEVVKLQQQVQVKVVEVDTNRKRIQLTMKGL